MGSRLKSWFYISLAGLLLFSDYLHAEEPCDYTCTDAGSNNISVSQLIIENEHDAYYRWAQSVSRSLVVEIEQLNGEIAPDLLKSAASIASWRYEWVTPWLRYDVYYYNEDPIGTKIRIKCISDTTVWNSTVPQWVKDLHLYYDDDDWKYLFAMTIMKSDSDRKFITSADIYINYAYRWSCIWDKPGCPPEGMYDLRSILVKQFGHVCGLALVGYPIDKRMQFFGLGPILTYSPCTIMSEDDLSYRHSIERRELKPLDKNAVLCLYGDENPASEIDGFSVVDGVATWSVSNDYGTSHYELEGCATLDGPGTMLATSPAGIGLHRVNVGACGYPLVRLVEVETSSMRDVKAVAKPTPSSKLPRIAAPAPSDEKELRKNLEILAARRNKEGEAAASGQRQRLTTSSPAYVIFTKSDFVSDAQTHVADYWEGRGYDAVVMDIGTYPSDQDEFRDALKSDIATYYNTYGTKYFHLIGDANDWREFDSSSDLWPLLWVDPYWQGEHADYIDAGYPPVGQPELDIIPTYSVPDTDNMYYGSGQNTARLTPYWFTDQTYADTDGDDVPDVVVTRWPIATTAELLALANKMQKYNDQAGAYGPYTVSFFVGDHSVGGQSGDIAREFADQVEDRLNQISPGDNINHLYVTDYPDAGERNNATASHWNANKPELIIILSANSRRYWPGYFFDKTVGTSPWNMNMLYSGTHTPLVIAASCCAASYSWTEDPLYNRPVCEEFLAADNRGAIAWVGPTMGSYQNANYKMTRYLTEELFDDPDRPMAESWLEAVRRLHVEYEDITFYLDTIDEYVFLGDPLSPFHQKADVPIYFDLTGPDQLGPQELGTFIIGNVSGGIPPYSYQWYWSDAHAHSCYVFPAWHPFGDNSTTAQKGSRSSFCIKAVVTDSEGQPASHTHHVYVPEDEPDIQFEQREEIPERYELMQNCPNPFNPVTTIRFDLPEVTKVRLAVFNVNGQLIRVLVDGEMTAGRKAVTWNGLDARGRAVASGIYFYRFETPKFTKSRKMLLFR